MGTRSLTHFVEDDMILVTLYRQMDGYPSGHGMELYDYLKSIKLVNGFDCTKTHENYANGVGCLAAQTIAYFKTDIGQFYIVLGREHYQDFEYFIREENDVIQVKVVANGETNKTVFDWNTLDNFHKFCLEDIS